VETNDVDILPPTLEIEKKGRTAKCVGDVNLVVFRSNQENICDHGKIWIRPSN
jgi:hypothetical protein